MMEFYQGADLSGLVGTVGSIIKGIIDVADQYQTSQQPQLAIPEYEMILTSNKASIYGFVHGVFNNDSNTGTIRRLIDWIMVVISWMKISNAHNPAAINLQDIINEANMTTTDAQMLEAEAQALVHYEVKRSYFYLQAHWK